MDEKKDQILEASKQLFNRMGYTKTSVDDIAQAVGMQKSSLYYYFKNKEELFCCSFIHDWGKIMQGFRESAEKESNPIDKLLNYITQSLHYYEEVVLQHRIPMKVIVETRSLFMDVFNDTNKKSIEFYESKINDGIKIGIFTPCNASKIARALFATKTALQYDNFRQFMNEMPTKESFKKIEKEVLFVVEMILQGIKK